MPELYLAKFGSRRGAFGARMLKLEERASAACADRVLAVHDLHRARLEEAGIPSRKIRTVFNSPDPKIFSAFVNGKATDVVVNDARAGKIPTLVCHGTITHRLGLDVALHALDLLRDFAVRLLVIGNGDYIGRVRSLAAEMKLEDRVQFAPPVPIEQLPEALRHADLGLVPNSPSPATHLMLPVKLLEYATLGIPVIAARLRTIEHYFGQGAVSLFEAGNPSALAAAIRELCLDRELATERARRALAVAQSLGWTRQSACFFDAIDSLLCGKETNAPQSANP
jgi:glycosyltransferase involved in cell wall biosynthesis